MHGPAAPNPASGLPSAKVMFIGNFMKPYFRDKVTCLVSDLLESAAPISSVAIVMGTGF